MAIRLGTSNNLSSNGTFDLLLIQFPQGYPEGKLVFDIGNTPRKITGVQKVGQIFIKLLMTRKGDDPINPNMGTYFVDYTMVANRIGVEQNVYSSIVDQINDAVQQVKYVLNTNADDATSQLQNVSIIGLDTTQDSISLYLQLTTMAGEEAAIAIPFPQLDLKLSQNG